MPLACLDSSEPDHAEVAGAIEGLGELGCPGVSFQGTANCRHPGESRLGSVGDVSQQRGQTMVGQLQGGVWVLAVA